MAKYSPKQLKASAAHKVPVRLTIRDARGEKQEIVTDVFYRGLSLDDQADFPSVEGLAGKERIDVFKRQLALLVLSIPDFGVGPAEEGQSRRPTRRTSARWKTHSSTQSATPSPRTATQT